MDDENLENKSTTTFSLGGGCVILTELSRLEGTSLASMVGTYGTVSADESTTDELPEGCDALGGDLCPLALGDFLDLPMFPMLRCDRCHAVTLSHCHTVTLLLSKDRAQSQKVWGGYDKI